MLLLVVLLFDSFYVSRCVQSAWVSGVKYSVFNEESYRPSVGWMGIVPHIVLFTCPFVLDFSPLTGGRHLNFSY